MNIKYTMILLLAKIVFMINFVSLTSDDLTYLSASGDIEDEISNEERHVDQLYSEWIVLWKILLQERKRGFGIIPSHLIESKDYEHEIEDYIFNSLISHAKGFIDKHTNSEIAQHYMDVPSRSRRASKRNVDLIFNDAFVMELIDSILKRGLANSNISYPSVQEPRENLIVQTPTPSTVQDPAILRHRLYQKYGHCRIFPAFSAEPLLMVDRCPLNTRDHHIFKLCHQGLSDINDNANEHCEINVAYIPVQDEYGIVYMNIYCSFCHGVENITSWSAAINTDHLSPIVVNDGRQTITLLDKVKFSECNRRIYPTDVSKITPCSIHNYGHGHGHARNLGDDNNDKTAVFPISFQVFMNFGITGKGHIFFSATKTSDDQVEQPTCPENKVFDSKTGRCREVVCEHGFRLRNSKCEPTADASNKDVQDNHCKI